MAGRGLDGAKKNTKDERATQMLALVRNLGAPKEIQEAAHEAMLHYMDACDLRRAAYGNRVSGVRLRNKAKRWAYLGDKKFKIAQEWVLARPQTTTSMEK